MRKTSGNMILMLFGAVAVAGVLGTGYMATMKGPGRSLSEVSKSNTIENNMMAATKLVVSGDSTQQDCDGDGTVEAKAFRSGAGPTGGGLVPLDAGAVKNDPWGKPLGYCVWDHGKKSVSDNVAECGGSSANRLQGGNISTEVMLAIVSAGKDGIFQTTCNAWADVNTDKIADTPLIVTTPGSDDIVKRDTIESLLASGALAQLPNLPDDACIAGAEGTLRYSNGVPQVCATTAPNGWDGNPATLPPPTWKEIGGASGSASNFTNVTNANLNQQYTSNAITISGFFGNRSISVNSGAVILVNGVPQGTSATIVPGDQVSLRATSSTSVMHTDTYTLKIGAVNKVWTITTKLPTPPVLGSSPASGTNMYVDGISGTAYGSNLVFTISNTGEDTANMNTPTLGSTTNFDIVSQTCGGASLATGQSCTVTVRPKGTTTGAISTTLTVSGTGVGNPSTYSVTPSLSGDVLFPVTLSNSNNVNISTLSDFTTNGRWAANRPKRVIIPSGVVIGSTSSGTAALLSGTGRGGTLYITNDGNIRGAGGTANGGVGGTAFLASQSGIQLTNNGNIWAGGGGGGAGGAGGNANTLVDEGYYYRNGGSTGGPPYYLWQVYTPGSSCPGCPYARFAWANSGAFTASNIPYNATEYVIGAYTYYRGPYYSGTACWTSSPYNCHFYVGRRSGANYPGGTGGTGGLGQGSNQARTNGTAGGSATAPAGAGGAGGNGGNWGVAGTNGTTGANGSTGSGVAGGAGGLAGWAIQNIAHVILTGGGSLLGR